MLTKYGDQEEIRKGLTYATCVCSLHYALRSSLGISPNLWGPTFTESPVLFVRSFSSLSLVY